MPSGIEHKLGMHASPTCTMTMGDNGGAVGYLIGEENRGMLCMFTMMNQARLGVGLEGVGIAERAYQQALALRAGAPPGPRHRQQRQGLGPDHRASRRQADADADARAAPPPRAPSATPRRWRSISRRAPPTPRSKADAAARGALLTPIAKAFSTDIGNEVASLGVQIHGGMGFVEETGAAQHLRDARITADLRGHQRHPGDRPRDAKTRRQWRRRGVGAAR